MVPKYLLRLLIGLLLVSPVALADGAVEVRGFSISGSQTVLDVFSVGLKYQSPSGQSDNYALDLNADSAQQRFAARYYGGRTSLQGQLTRQSDQDAGTSTTSATFSYAYSPEAAPDGAALTSVSAFYAFNGSVSPTQGVTVHTGGINLSGRLVDHVYSSLNATLSDVLVNAGDYSSQQLTTSLSGNVSYSDSTTSAYLSPSASLSGDTFTYGVGLGGRTALNPDTALSVNGYVTSSSLPSGTVDLQYDASRLFGPDAPRGLLGIGGYVSYNSPFISLGVRARSAITPDLNVGASVGYTPGTSSVTYGADASGRLGGVYISLNSSLATLPNSAPAFSVGGSVSAASAPWYGSLYGSYQIQGATTSVNAAGSFGYHQTPLDLNVTLALNAYPQLSGIADLKVSYAITERVFLSGSMRYQRSSSLNSLADIRYGVGVKYVF